MRSHLETRAKVVYGRHDVLCGRGKKAEAHVGNFHFRALVKMHRVLFAVERKNKQKYEYARNIVKSIRALDPPGRFLRYDFGRQSYYDIGDEMAIEKTRQALRDETRGPLKKVVEGCKNWDVALILKEVQNMNREFEEKFGLFVPPPMTSVSCVSEKGMI